MKAVPVKQNSINEFRVVHFDSERTSKKSRAEQVFDNFSFFPEKNEELKSMQNIEKQYPEAKRYEARDSDFEIDMYLLNKTVYKNINREKNNQALRRDILALRNNSKAPTNQSIDRLSTDATENPEPDENKSFFSKHWKQLLAGSAIVVGAIMVGSKLLKR